MKNLTIILLDFLFIIDSKKKTETIEQYQIIYNERSSRVDISLLNQNHPAYCNIKKNDRVDRKQHAIFIDKFRYKSHRSSARPYTTYNNDSYLQILPNR